MMKYIFGQTASHGEPLETLKTVGEAHTALTGYQQVVREYPDQKIIDKFHVVRRYQSAEDGEGRCYDWYIIDGHYRYTESANVPLEQAITELELTAIEQGQQITELELFMLGGNENV